MSTRLPLAQLDEILALQLTVAWAGESAGDPARLGWWPTDLVDPEGGGDLFARLAPRTHAWASLGLVRKAAARVDASAREKIAGGDHVWTLYHFGFEVDEQLTERLTYLRQHEQVPAEVLGKHFLVGQPWSKPSLETMLAGLGRPRVEATPAGRKVQAACASPVEAALLLAAALAPLASSYPVPFVELPR